MSYLTEYKRGLKTVEDFKLQNKEDKPTLLLIYNKKTKKFDFINSKLLTSSDAEKIYNNAYVKDEIHNQNLNKLKVKELHLECNRVGINIMKNSKKRKIKKELINEIMNRKQLCKNIN